MDNECTRFFSTVTEHRAGQELSDTIGLDVVRAIKRYYEIHKILPARIMFYRDGAGDGQIGQVIEHEIASIKKKMDEVYNSFKVTYKLTYIIINKRINTRLFMSGVNPPAGTVADSVITNPLRYDFFLISQSVTQGTVSPTYYNVIEDTSGWTPDIIQRLSYKLCHTYYNTAATTRVPSPVHYAHKLAFLVSQSIHRIPHELLQNLLYFL